MGERFWKPNTSSKGLLIFNQGDTLAEEVDCNVWEGECARGDDSSMQRWSCQVSGWLILASEVGAGCEQECRPPWRRVPSIRVVTPTLCWLDWMGRWIREGQLRHVPRPKVQTMDFVHLSASCLLLLLLSLSHFLLCCYVMFTFLKCLTSLFRGDCLKKWFTSVCILTILLKCVQKKCLGEGQREFLSTLCIVLGKCY